jgi:hypothetical protein
MMRQNILLCNCVIELIQAVRDHARRGLTPKRTYSPRHILLKPGNGRRYKCSTLGAARWTAGKHAWEVAAGSPGESGRRSTAVAARKRIGCGRGFEPPAFAFRVRLRSGECPCRFLRFTDCVVRNHPGSACLAGVPGWRQFQRHSDEYSETRRLPELRRTRSPGPAGTAEAAGGRDANVLSFPGILRYHC